MLAILLGCQEESANADRSSGSALDDAFSLDTLRIINDAGDELEIDVYLALTREQQKRGLMFVRSLPRRTGMLFVYDEEAYLSMWMKNTFIPLDIAFARADGSIANIVYNATPQTLDSRAATDLVIYALELNAGVARELGLGTSSRLLVRENYDDTE